MTAYGYDGAGRVNAVTNALGNVTVYAYDVRGRLTSAGGAVYPVGYEYDVYGNRTKMTTFRDEEGEGDVTAWAYDAATGAVVSKTYADGRGSTYTLTDLGQVATRTDARGVVTTYAYNPYGDLVSQTYSDGTPSVTYAYDSLGRQTQATDAAGTTTFTYGQYGELVSEGVSGGYAKTLTRHTDAFGRDVGYSLDGVRQRTVTYDADTGRLSGMDGFAWEYLPGSDLKSKLTYPNGATAEWTYEEKRDLLTQVKNTVNGTIASQYDYTNAGPYLRLRRYRQPHRGRGARLCRQQPQPVHRHRRLRAGIRPRRQSDEGADRDRHLDGHLQRREPAHPLGTG